MWLVCEFIRLKNLTNLNLKNHVWLVDTILDSTGVKYENMFLLTRGHPEERWFSIIR